MTNPSETSVAKSNKRAAPSRVSQNKSPSGMGSKNPPMLNASISVQHRLRFINNSDPFSGEIDSQEILDLLCVGVTATTAARVCDAVRIKSAELWACNTAAVYGNTVELEWLNNNSGNFGPGKTFSDTALGLNDIAHISCKPPKDSTAAFWLNETHGTDGLIRLAMPENCVLDLVLELVFYDNDTPLFVGNAVSGATPGKFYCRALDNSDATPLIIPVSYDTI